MKPPSPLTRKIATLAVGPVAFLAAGALVVQGSYAAFESDTRNAGNNWRTGQVSLTNDSNGTARFTVPSMVPGDTATACVKVTSTASVPGTVKFYFLNPAPAPVAGELASYINMEITQGDGGTFSDCTGFVADGSAIFNNTLYNGALNHANWTDAVGSWGVTSGSKTYKFTWTFDAAAPDSVQNHSFGTDFEWEMQND